MEKLLTEELKQKLGKEQARLRAALGSVSKEGRSFEPVFEEMGSDEEANQDEVEQYEVNRGIDQELEATLMRVEHALEKIEKGAYGVCEKCGADIPLLRLQAAPEAEYCLEHA